MTHQITREEYENRLSDGLFDKDTAYDDFCLLLNKLEENDITFLLMKSPTGIIYSGGYQTDITLMAKSCSLHARNDINMAIYEIIETFKDLQKNYLIGLYDIRKVRGIDTPDGTELTMENLQNAEKYIGFIVRYAAYRMTKENE